MADIESNQMGRLIVQSGTGSLITGDQLSQRFRLNNGARVQVVGQGAMAVHRQGNDTGIRETLRLGVAHNCRLEFLQEPRIIFAGSRYEQDCQLEADGELIFVDAVIAHPDSGPSTYSSVVDIFRDGHHVAAERTGFTDLDSLFVPASALILAINIHQDPAKWSDWLQKHSTPSSYGSISSLSNAAGHGVKIVARDGRLLRIAVQEALELFDVADAQAYAE